MDFLHKASSYVVNHAVKNKISAIYVGRNIGWKQEANMGRVNNQKFCSIPHSKFIEMLKYKAKIKGIRMLLLFLLLVRQRLVVVYLRDFLYQILIHSLIQLCLSF